MDYFVSADSTVRQTVTVCPSCYHQHARLTPVTVTFGRVVFRLPDGEQIGTGCDGWRFCGVCGWTDEGEER